MMEKLCKTSMAYKSTCLTELYLTNLCNILRHACNCHADYNIGYKESSVPVPFLYKKPFVPFIQPFVQATIDICSC